jgi:two-component system NarL family response regulator
MANDTSQLAKSRPTRAADREPAVSPSPRVVVAQPPGAAPGTGPERLGRWLAIPVVTSRPALEHAVVSVRPDVLFLDLGLPGLGGVGGLARILRLSPATRVILLTRSPNETQAVFALLAGARGYCHREMSPLLYRKAAAVVLRGEVWIGRRVILRLLERLAALTRRRGRSGQPDPFHELAPREIEIAELIGGGASNKEIAARLSITESTVKAHLTSVFRKLGVPDRLRLALFMTEHRGDPARTSGRRAGQAGNVAVPGLSVVGRPQSATP